MVTADTSEPLAPASSVIEAIYHHPEVGFTMPIIFCKKCLYIGLLALGIMTADTSEPLVSAALVTEVIHNHPEPRSYLYRP